MALPFSGGSFPNISTRTTFLVYCRLLSPKLQLFERSTALTDEAHLVNLAAIAASAGYDKVSIVL